MDADASVHAMFEATIDDISLFRDSIATIAELIDEAEFVAKDTGIELLAADRAVVTVVEFKMHRNAFKEYTHDDQDSKIGINLLNLLQILRRAGPDDRLKMRLSENKLYITLSGKSTRRFTLPLIDISREETPPMDKLEFSTHLRMNSDLLTSGIEDADLITDSAVITVRKDAFLVQAQSDVSSTELEVLADGHDLKILEIGEPVRARYSLDYLKKIIKAKKLSEEAEIYMATDYPLKMVFNVPGKAGLSFILAPRVEE